MKIVFSKTITDEMVERAAKAHKSEYERWCFRRKMDKSGYEAVREHDVNAPTCDENMTVYDLGTDHDGAVSSYAIMLEEASARAALEAALEVFRFCVVTIDDHHR